MSFFFRNVIKSRRKKKKGRVNVTVSDIVSKSDTNKQPSIRHRDNDVIKRSSLPQEFIQQVSQTADEEDFPNRNSSDETAYRYESPSTWRKGQQQHLSSSSSSSSSMKQEDKATKSHSRSKDSHGKRPFSFKSLWRKSSQYERKEKEPHFLNTPDTVSSGTTCTVTSCMRKSEPPSSSSADVKVGIQDTPSEMYGPTDEPNTPIKLNFEEVHQTTKITPGRANIGTTSTIGNSGNVVKGGNQLQLRSINAQEQSTIPLFLVTNKDSSELRKGTRNIQPIPSVTKKSATTRRTNNVRNNNNYTKTVVMNGDIVLRPSYNSNMTSDTATITSVASSSNKSRALRRESERNARAASSLDEKGNELFEKGYFDKAMACYTKALKLKRRTFTHLLEEADDIEEQLMPRGGGENSGSSNNKNKNNNSTDPKILVSMATSINNIGYLRQRSGDATPEETMAAYKKSLRIKRRILGNDSLSVGKTLNNIGSVHYLKRDFDRALPAYEEAFEIMKANLGSDHPDVATVMSNIGDVYLAKGDHETSLQYYRLALTIRWEKFGEGSPRVVRLLEKISNLEIGDRMTSKARRNKTQHGWDDDETLTSEAMESGFHPITNELKLLQEQVTKDIEQVNQMERRATVEMLKDKIIIIRGMRDTWNGTELIDNDSASVMTAMSRRSRGCS